MFKRQWKSWPNKDKCIIQLIVLSHWRDKIVLLKHLLTEYCQFQLNNICHNR